MRSNGDEFCPTKTVVRVCRRSVGGLCSEMNASDSSRVMRRSASRPWRARSARIASPFLPRLIESKAP